jgi:O-antigen ligase
MTTLIVAVLGMAAIVNRGSFVSVAAGIGVLWLLDRRNTGKLVARIFAIGLIALTVAFALDLRASVFANEREVSAQQFVTNMMSVVDPAAGGQDLSGTADWRLQYWSKLIADVRTQRPLTGLGFGPNLRERYGEQDEEVPARDTHNSHIGVYARSGLIGLTLWILVWWTWFAHVLRIRKAARESGDITRVNLAGWLIAAIVAILVNAVFDPSLEGPQVAIWTWTLFGIGAALSVTGHSTASVASRPRRTSAGTPHAEALR